jgi:NADPH:quinone reductase-like Zn-dependent oxidoreductase
MPPHDTVCAMRAARLVAFGDVPEFAVVDVADPEPGPDEVVVDLRAAALNRRDWWIWTAPGYCPLPVTLGSDGAGIVSAVGSEVTGLAVGDEVVIDPTFGWPAGSSIPGPDFDILGAPLDGTFAERVRIPAANIAPRPRRLSWEEAAAVNLAGLTAWRATVTCAAAAPERTILVTGAGSGVATFAVQIAVALGATVFATTSSEGKARRLEELGVAQVFLYGEPDWHEQVKRAAGGGLDAVIDSYGADGWAKGLKALRVGGTFVTFGDTGSAEATVEIADVYWQWRSIVGTSMGSPEEFRAMLAHVETASWRPVIDSVFRLDRIAEAAHRLASEPDRFGKIVLLP